MVSRPEPAEDAEDDDERGRPRRRWVHYIRRGKRPPDSSGVQRQTRSVSAPPHPRRRLCAFIVRDRLLDIACCMLASPSLEFILDPDDSWTKPQSSLFRAASVGSWGVTSIGRGFKWDDDDASGIATFSSPKGNLESSSGPLIFDLNSNTGVLHTNRAQLNQADSSSNVIRCVTNIAPNSPSPLSPFSADRQKFVLSPVPSRSESPSSQSSIVSNHIEPSFKALSHPPSRTPSVCSPTAPRPRRRSSQQRVSLIAGRVSIAPIEPPSPMLPPNLIRANSTSSLLSAAVSTRAPSPTSSQESFLGDKTIEDFVIESDIGRGAYGLVKRAREKRLDGTLGPPIVLKQVIKQRILADCWKKHPKYGTIPIEIYVMSAISNTSYVLPARRPWDPSRLSYTDSSLRSELDDDEWTEGKIVKGHPNICPLIDFFEDNHYYYLVLPSSTPEPAAELSGQPPSDLFELVEAFPHGLPPSSIRTYLGQIADALCFLHSHGIVHRDVKDENVVLGPCGKAILIDFGSSGLVKKSGWDTFSGTLDYAGPEILRGERYFGKEQDVWAFGVVAYVLLVGECPFMTAAEAQEGLESPFANASICLDERCGEGKELEGEEGDGGGALGDAAILVRACLQLNVSARPTFEKILQSRFLAGKDGWGMDRT